MLIVPLGPGEREVRRWPWVTIAIVALNVFVFLQTAAPWRTAQERRDTALRWGFVCERPSPVTAVTSAFLHADGWHLASNMVALLATGPFLEDVYGRALYPALYLGSAVAGAYLQREISDRPDVPGVGASGAVFGVEGAFALRFGASRLRFFLAPVGFLPFLGFRVRLRAAVVLLLGFLEQASLLGTAGGNIAYGDHVGGFVFGALVAVLVRAWDAEGRWIHPAIEAQIGWQQHPLLVRAGEARLAGNLAEARRDVRKALQEEPGNADGWALAARLSLDLADGPEAVYCAGRAVPLYLAKGESDPAADIALEVLRKARPSLTPRFGGMVAALMERRGETVDAVSIYQEVAGRFPEDDAGRHAAARLEALRGQDRS